MDRGKSSMRGFGLDIEYGVPLPGVMHSSGLDRKEYHAYRLCRKRVWARPTGGVLVSTGSWAVW